MLPLILPIGMLLCGVALLLLGSGLLNTLLALRGGIEGYDTQLIGLIMSGYFVGFLIGTFTALPLIQRIGHVRAFAFCAALTACSVLAHTLVVGPWAWLALRVVTGTCLVTLYTLIESWLNDRAPSAQRGQLFSVYMMVNLGALALAQQLIRLDSPARFTLFAVSAIMICLAVLPVMMARAAPVVPERVLRMSIRRLYRAAPVGVAGALLAGLAGGAFWGLAPVYAEHAGLDKAGVAVFMTCAILGGALFQLPLGRYSDRRDRRQVLFRVALASAATAGLLALLTTLGYGISAAAFLYGGFAFAVYPVTVAHLIDRLAPEDILAGSSSLLLLNGVGSALGPALAGVLMQSVGSYGLPLYFVVVQLLLAGYALLRLRATGDISVGEPAHFVPMVRTTPAALEMLEGATLAEMTEEDVDRGEVVERGN